MSLRGDVTLASGNVAQLPSWGVDTVLDTFFERYDLWLNGPRETLPTPWHTLNAGIAGLVYAFWLLGEHNHRRLEVADALSDLSIERLDSLTTPKDCLPLERQTSLFHSHAGVWLVRSLVLDLRGDETGSLNALAKGMELLDIRASVHDVTLGNGGLVLAAGWMYSKHRSNGARSLIQDFGDRAAGFLADVIAKEPVVGGSIEDLNFAHGWAGILYALLRYARARMMPLPDIVVQRLDELSELAKGDADSGRYWEPVPFAQAWGAPSWCNGAAGQVHLWLLADAMFPNVRYRALAEDAAYFCGNKPVPHGFLCCGALGSAFALNAVYRHTGDRGWLDQSLRLAELSGQIFVKRPREEPEYHGLFSGVPGLAVFADAAARGLPALLPVVEG